MLYSIDFNQLKIALNNKVNYQFQYYIKFIQALRQRKLAYCS